MYEDALVFPSQSPYCLRWLLLQSAGQKNINSIVKWGEWDINKSVNRSHTVIVNMSEQNLPTLENFYLRKPEV